MNEMPWQMEIEAPNSSQVFFPIYAFKEWKAPEASVTLECLYHYAGIYTRIDWRGAQVLMKELLFVILSLNLDFKIFRRPFTTTKQCLRLFLRWSLISPKHWTEGGGEIWISWKLHKACSLQERCCFCMRNANLLGNRWRYHCSNKADV